MSVYIISKNISIKIQNQFQDYFDPTDQDKWTDLLRIAKKDNALEKITKFPEKAPADLNVWLALYTIIPNSEFPIGNEELSSTSVQMQLVNDPDDDSEDCVDITLDV